MTEPKLLIRKKGEDGTKTFSIRIKQDIVNQIDELSEKGIVGPYEGSKPRKVLITKEQWYEMQARSGSSAPKQLTIEEVTAPKITAPVFEYHDTDDADDDASSDIGNSNYFGGAVSSYQDEE